MHCLEARLDALIITPYRQPGSWLAATCLTPAKHHFVRSETITARKQVRHSIKQSQQWLCDLLISLSSQAANALQATAAVAGAVLVADVMITGHACQGSATRPVMASGRMYKLRS